MASAHIQALLEPPSTADAEKHTLDFVNSRFKSYQDLEQAQDFDDIVEQSRLRDEELAVKHIHTAQELSLLRHSLADELSFLSQELVSTLDGPEGEPTLLEDIETLHRNLKELQSVKGYIQVIEHALKLRESAVVASRSSSPFDCVSRFEELQKFVSSVTAACAQAQDAAGQQKLHIVTALEQIQEHAWSEIKSSFTSTLVEAAEKLRWPLPVDYALASSADRTAFELAFHNLLKLQSA
ncbi:hypothetical protein EIP86_003534 [Pleurotus ostreatoroseus]|nr:hypothetical protein EIP86_003534 [Pleurotus ostreatoroseus]